MDFNLPKFIDFTFSPFGGLILPIIVSLIVSRASFWWQSGRETKHNKKKWENEAPKLNTYYILDNTIEKDYWDKVISHRYVYELSLEQHLNPDDSDENQIIKYTPLLRQMNPDELEVYRFSGAMLAMSFINRNPNSNLSINRIIQSNNPAGDEISNGAMLLTIGGEDSVCILALKENIPVGFRGTYLGEYITYSINETRTYSIVGRRS